MTNFSIKTFNGSIQNQSVQLINARELHNFLQSKQHFSDWIKKRISDYGFEENLDFIGVHKKMITEAGFFGSRQKEVKEYHITLDMAKELCMLERSEIGRQARRHFIKMEQHAIALATEMQAQMLAIPTFLRNNPDELARLITTAQTAFLTANPQAKDFLRYREMGLSYREIGTLLGKTKDSVKWMAFKMRNLGFFSSTLPKITAVQLDLLA
ncbi:phage anti-repressor protein [Haemophilus influenzae]|uniref:antA/AntB antirepressor family protein n=1 Tax=Haemophilus influenzae TaxID=727 RepID=UPI000766BE60|nr:antA/AntB antirepressor family protein [Haemophilus influenzae]AWP55607.1 phage antirepressor Ant [Haemophilus influenzae]MCK8943255.1 antA/AntB antirepressor family protein [Haemophilus influenzae]MCK8948958.1 antA/AntB antirepressor family protein [Haemophilus influenzae]PRI73297.1 AntA/AntB antirepressor [Haemophilus influenzae]PRJ97241.1 AntA/AntB antirepressor [Haemophilus influenzae]